jgi:ABC-type spermidine/putrescine transport system permease subunit II
MLAFTMSFDDYVITSFVSGTGVQTRHRGVHDGCARTSSPASTPFSTVILVGTTILVIVADRLVATNHCRRSPHET